MKLSKQLLIIIAMALSVTAQANSFSQADILTAVDTANVIHLSAEEKSITRGSYRSYVTARNVCTSLWHYGLACSYERTGSSGTATFKRYFNGGWEWVTQHSY